MRQLTAFSFVSSTKNRPGGRIICIFNFFSNGAQGGEKLMKCRNGLARPTPRKVGYVERNRHKERERQSEKGCASCCGLPSPRGEKAVFLVSSSSFLSVLVSEQACRFGRRKLPDANLETQVKSGSHRQDGSQRSDCEGKRAATGTVKSGSLFYLASVECGHPLAFTFRGSSARTRGPWART
jgi:hypothetical protein